MDVNTFGNSPAAMYLADMLMLQDQRVSRKVTRILQTANQAFNEAFDAHRAGIVSAKTLTILVEGITEKAEQTINKSGLDLLIMNLTRNIIHGSKKTLIRGLTQTIRTSKSVSRTLPYKGGPQLSFVENLAIALCAKSSARTRRRIQYKKANNA